MAINGIIPHIRSLANHIMATIKFNMSHSGVSKPNIVMAEESTGLTYLANAAIIEMEQRATVPIMQTTYSNDLAAFLPIICQNK